jgi:hypothetical protein
MALRELLEDYSVRFAPIFLATMSAPQETDGVEAVVPR